MVYALMAILAGVCIVLSRLVNFKLSNKIGVLQSTFFNYVVGLIVSVIVLIISGERIVAGMSVLEGVPWWALLGGVVGVVVVSLQIYLTSKISVFYVTIFIFLGQLIIGGIVDYVSFGDFSIGKLLGGAFVLAGLIYNLRVDQTKKCRKDYESVSKEVCC